MRWTANANLRLGGKPGVQAAHMEEEGAGTLHQPGGRLDAEARRPGELGDEMDAIGPVHVVGRLRPAPPAFDDRHHGPVSFVRERERELPVAARDLALALDQDLTPDRTEQDRRCHRMGGEAQAGVDPFAGRIDGAGKDDKGVREIIAAELARVKGDLDRGGRGAVRAEQEKGEEAEPPPQF